MSRIDEVLRRAWGGQASDHKGITLVGDNAARPADDYTLDNYPREHPSSAEASTSATIAASAAGVVEREPFVTPAAAPLTPVPPAPRAVPPSKVRVTPVRMTAEGRLVVEGSPALVEQYRRLAVSLHEAQAERGLKTLLFTSARPREGKTQAVVNLALTLSETFAQRVLVIDADLRDPMLHEVVGVDNEVGLGEALRAKRFELTVLEVSPLLSVLPAGEPEPDPVAALASDRMRMVLDECASRFDWVLLDAPPAGALPDAQILARVTQAVIFVISAGTTPFPVVEKAMTELGRECIFGTVLHGLEPRVPPAGAARAT